MSSHKLLLNSSEDSEVMVRQVNLAAAFHDHISCTKISQQSIQTNICGLQTSVDINQSQTQLPYETDHIYATESKSVNSNDNNNNMGINGMIGNNMFHNNGSDERNQIQKLTEMILGQLDLIQHQQEQLLKKDRQLQGLKQDREALCLRLEKMEKRIAVLTTKVMTVNNTSVNNTSTNLNLNRNVVNSTPSSVNTIETDCEQSGSDTIVEDNNSSVSLFTDPNIFTKLCARSSTVSSQNSDTNTSINAFDNSLSITTTSKAKSNTSSANTSPTVRIKTEPQIKVEPNESTTSTTSFSSFRKNRKRHTVTASTVTSNNIPNRKRSKSSSFVNTNSVIPNVEIKKETLKLKETFSDTSQTVISNKKKLIKQRGDNSRHDTCSTSSSSKTSSVIKDILHTNTPYSITINVNQSPVEQSVVNNNSDDKSSVETNVEINKCVEDKNNTSESDNIEVPNWRLHPVSSCYSLEGTENLDDEVFNRRHSKLEIDERRRKRWDIQRLREQRHNEKLRTGRYYSGSLVNCFIEKPSDLKTKPSEEITSFYPELKNVQSIEVTEKLPVIAFGHAVPRIPHKYFSLPWCVSSEKSQTISKNKKSVQKNHL